MRFLRQATLLVAIAACGSTAVGTYEGFATNACDALAVLPRLEVGELTRALDEAVRSGNVERAGDLVAAITLELERSRQSAAAASAWKPGATVMFHLDRLLVANEAVLQAKLQRAARDPAAPDAAAAFGVAGGENAWALLQEAAESVRLERPPGVPPHECENGGMSW
jgi:hypothetical protein